MNRTYNTECSWKKASQSKPVAAKASGKQIDIISAFKAPRLFRPLFPEPSWLAWTVCMKATWGIELDAAELELFRQCTGRNRPPKGGARELWCIVGRRGGKSRIIAYQGVYIACFRDFRKFLAPGERGVVLILARDRDQAKVLFSYVAGYFDAIPALRQMIIRRTSDEIELDNRITIKVGTSDFRPVRGVTIVASLNDETCFWDNQGVSPDSAIFAALRPAMITIPGAKLLAISSPYGRFGAMFEVYRRYYGQDDPDILVWKAPTTVMNPSVPESFIQAEAERDPEAARSEYYAEFREDVSQAFSLESIEQCIIPGRTELLPAPAIGYQAFVDPSGGRRDQFAVAIAHRKGDIAIIDLAKAWKPPFDPAEIVKECAAVLRPYRIRSVSGDNYGGEWPVAEFRKHGVTYQLAEKHRSELYLSLIPAVNSKRVELPDDRRMIDELRRLERRRGRSGKDTVDHPQHGGSDDLANAVAGAVDLILSKPNITHGFPQGVGDTGLGSMLTTMNRRNPFTTLGAGNSGRLSYGIPATGDAGRYQPDDDD